MKNEFEQITFTMIKPDAFKKSHDIFKMILSNGFELIGKGIKQLDREKVEEFYADHKGKDFFERNIEFIISGQVYFCVWQKDNAITDMRKLCGATDPKKAEPGTIRYQFGTELPKNAIHASDSLESVYREIFLFHNDILYT
jgi:nucleoside-diphosphate kinase